MGIEPPTGESASDELRLRRALDATEFSTSESTDEETPETKILAIPTRIGRYHIKRIIASGGMGTVYEATQEKPRRTVAVKLMRAGLSSRTALRRFEYEAQSLARLRHPGIAQVYEADTHRDGEMTVPFFAMEYIVGAKRITDYARESGLGTRARMELFVEVCAAVHHGHQKGIIHRDLKPSNILVDSSGQVKIIDFGAARSTDADMAVTTLQTGVGQLIGTVQYMSPEQCAADPHDIDTRSDVYALGVVFYELLCEQLPYEVRGSMLHEATRVIQEQEPVRLSALNRALRGDVETIVLKALEKNRDRRYQSASALTADIRRYLNNEPISARPASALYQFRKLVSRHRAPFAFVGALFLLIIAFGAWMSVMYTRAEQLREDAVAAEHEQARARQEAEEARDTLETVTEFQRSMLNEIDAALMGQGIYANIRVDIREAMQRDSADVGRVQSAIRSFDDLVASVNATDLALKLVDENVLSRAVETIRKEFADRPVTGAALEQTVANTYRDIGLYQRAMPLQQACLRTRLRELGDDHPDSLSSMNHMGTLLFAMGDFIEAEPYYREALDRRRRVLGDDHPDTLTSTNNLGALLEMRGKLTDAEPFFREALEGRRRVLGDDHADTLTSIHNMGLLLKAEGKLDQAERFLGEAVDGHRRVLGDDHRSTLVSIANMGHLLVEKGEYSTAEPYYREALTARRRVLGDDHPQTLGTIDNMGELYHAMGRYAEAERYFRESLEGRRRVLGDTHESTVEGTGNLGALLTELGRYDEAVRLIRSSEAAARRVYVGEHARWLGNHLRKLGAALVGNGDFSEAERTLFEAYGMLSAGFGDDHIRTRKCVQRLVLLYESWHAKEPGKGHDAQAGRWRAKLPGDPSE